MKKILLSAITFLCAVHTSFAADIYVNNSGQPGTWSTITLALAAAAPGDRVFVSPYGAYTENLTIVQNVTLTSAVSGTVFNLVGTITVIGNANMDVRIIGCEASGTITCNTGAATLTNKANIYLSDCKFSSITGNDFCVMHVLYCYGTPTINIRHGEVRGCTQGLNTLTIADGPNAGVGDTLYIVGNKIISSLNWQNDDNYFFIANNLVTGVSTFSKHQYSTVVINKFLNNTFVSGSANATANITNAATIVFSTPSNRSNIEFWNCLVSNTNQTSASGYSVGWVTNNVGTMNSYYCWYDSPVLNITHVIESSAGGTGTAVITYDAYGRGTDANNAPDKGSPSIQFYDIDMTRNDRGTFGGPYSIDNYINTANGKARVYDLNMPFEIWSGSTPQVKAEATHIK